MAFRKKIHALMAFEPDLIVIQECENEHKLSKALEDINYNQVIWHGKNPNKGLAAISFNDVQIKTQKDYNKEFEYVIPIALKHQGSKINLFNIWAMPHHSTRSKDYVGQVWGAINFYKSKLNKPSLLIGDFNSNAIWDKKRKEGNHNDVVQYLAKRKIDSLYHLRTKQAHGSEKEPTLYLLKNNKKPYHLDYCFASSELINSKTTLVVGRHDDWIKLSDHMPLIISNIAEPSNT